MQIQTFVSMAMAMSFDGCASTRCIPSDAHEDAAVTSATTLAQEEMTPPLSNSAAKADDPTATDSDKYQTVMENKKVRVLRYQDEVSAKTHQHSHPDSMLYAASDFRRRLIFPDGTVKEREFKQGDIMWVPAQIHVGENIGNTATEVILIEIKH
jgi:beta-alanine degradation protein BauB